MGAGMRAGGERLRPQACDDAADELAHSVRLEDEDSRHESVCR
jgi:hypothetical protein